MDVAEPGALADRCHPPVSGAAVESFPVPALEDRAVVALTDRQVDRAGRSRDDRDSGGLVALPGDPQYPMATFGGQVLDVWSRTLR